MVQIFPDDGLEKWFDRLTAGGIEAHMFVNNAGPTRGTVLGDLVEASWGGYAPVVINPGDWFVIGVLNHRLKAFAAIEIPVSFGVTPVYYGYYLTSPGGSNLLAVAQYDGAPVTSQADEPVPITPLLGDFSGSF